MDGNEKLNKTLLIICTVQCSSSGSLCTLARKNTSEEVHGYTWFKRNNVNFLTLGLLSSNSSA